jgi:integrase
MEGRIGQKLGHIKLSQLKPQQISRAYREMLGETCQNNGRAGEPLSAATVHHYHRAFRAMLNTAVKWGVIANNPALKATLPKNDAKRGKAYTPEQAIALLEALEAAPLKHRTGVAVALYCSLRKGELCGLDWDAIDFERGILSVRKNAVVVKGHGVVLKEPKTESSKRDISIPAPALELLRALKAEQTKERLKAGALWQDCGAVFAQRNGIRQYPTSIGSWFYKFLKLHDLPHIRFHDLRHTGASMLLNTGRVPLQIVTERLGHGSSATTAMIYNHSNAQHDRAAADWLGDLLTPKKGRNGGVVPK